MPEAKTIDIHGKAYVTVAERVRVAHEDLKAISITSEVLFTEPVVVKATVVTPKGTFTGISAANPSKVLEKQSPYEIAETSAVGRALGFAGYGIVDSIASADEIVKAEVTKPLYAPKGPVEKYQQQTCVHEWSDPWKGKKDPNRWWKKCALCELVKPAEPSVSPDSQAID